MAVGLVNGNRRRQPYADDSFGPGDLAGALFLLLVLLLDLALWAGIIYAIVRWL